MDANGKNVSQLTDRGLYDLARTRDTFSPNGTIEAFNAPDPNNTILLPGYQALGTRGAALVGGADSIKIHGAYVPVRAEVVRLDGFSAHADQRDLLAWLGACERPPRRVYVIHGEAAAADLLRQRIQQQLGFAAEVAEHGHSVRLG